MTRLAAHAAMFNNIHPDLEMACHRFVDSGRRIQWQDTILDSVMGLETILLAGIKERSELSYRFALHYSMLYPKDERLAAFKTARDLYDLRSRISHGTSVKPKIRIGTDQLTPTEAAARARTILRKTIMEFVPGGQKPAFKDTEYWLSKVLGL
jgi:Apea-like HEPN